ncbi:MAG: hypothetical protein JSW58_08560 [Candidatus Latescibacterota bacterium]|nr:MAG: hypothetical protein JSW58_08560 [Candidatus Latescibacterota bacterium]
MIRIDDADRTKVVLDVLVMFKKRYEEDAKLVGEFLGCIDDPSGSGEWPSFNRGCNSSDVFHRLLEMRKRFKAEESYGD